MHCETYLFGKPLACIAFFAIINIILSVVQLEVVDNVHRRAIVDCNGLEFLKTKHV